MLVNFQIKDIKKKMRFFQKTFLIANTAIEIVLEMFFLFINKVKINFVE